ncbi:MAG: ferrochelatase [Clostridia bacterium]|nr:ferrochelatase [Clostridia bacterium]
MDAGRFEALLVLSFGGPEAPEDVMPFLRHVARGRPIPEERLREVAEHYLRLGGRSPINDQNRALVRALAQLLARKGPRLPVYFGNRHWHPFVEDTVRQMAADGVRRALVFATSAFSSYSGCRQYLEDLARARRAAGPRAPELVKLRPFYNHPSFLQAVAARVRDELLTWPAAERARVQLVFTAHSIPLAMARASDYVAQLEEAARLVVGLLAEGGPRLRHRLVYQSRSGRPEERWLEPDVLDGLEALAREGVRDAVLVPIGFLSDHVEVLHDLDHEARDRAQALGLRLRRAATVGTHPLFLEAVRELVLERTDGHPRRALGDRGPAPDDCPAGCCLAAHPEPRTQPSGEAVSG